MLTEERHQSILQILASEGAVSVVNLCERLNVSKMTIRRDLRLLEDRGLLRRVRGGAISGRGRSFEPPFLLRAGEHQAEKELIGKCAAAMVKEGDSIALDVGTTTLEVARHLRGKTDLTVITASLPIANLLANQAGIRLIVTGGILRFGEGSFIGDLAVSAFQNFYVDKAFIGIGGISLDAGLTEYNLEDARVKKTLISSAKDRIVVTDASKFGRVTFAAVASLGEINKIVTDKLPTAKFLSELKKRDVKVVVAS